jgi:hypothetical protein
MVVRATRDIAAGEDITHTYVDPLEPIQVRDGKIRHKVHIHLFRDLCNLEGELVNKSLLFLFCFVILFI